MSGDLDFASLVFESLKEKHPKSPFTLFLFSVLISTEVLIILRFGLLGRLTDDPFLYFLIGGVSSLLHTEKHVSVIMKFDFARIKGHLFEFEDFVLPESICKLLL